MTSLAEPIVPWINLYVESLAYEFHGKEQPYLFFVNQDSSRNVSSSQWCTLVKHAFAKFSPGKVGPPPKLLRASFITALRSSDATDDVLRSAATTMRHLIDTQSSDVYDRATHDKLCSAAMKWTAEYAAKFPATLDSGGSSSTLPPQQTSVTTTEAPEPAQQTQKEKLPMNIPGSFKARLSTQQHADRRSFTANVPWQNPFKLGASLQFTSSDASLPVIKFQLSHDKTAEGKSVNLTFSLPHGFASEEITLSGLQLTHYSNKKHVPRPTSTTHQPAPKQAPKQKPVTQKSQEIITKESNLTEALSGSFSYFEYMEHAPEWLQTALIDSPEHLIGSQIVFRWEGYGWAAGKVTSTSKREDSNVVVTYEANWKEEHALIIDGYGTEGYGSWMLLKQVRPPPKLVDFKNGKYQRDSDHAWLRACDLIMYLDSEMEEARANSNLSKRRNSNAQAAEEVSTANFKVGHIVFAQTFGPTGEVAFYKAMVIALRERYPPIEIKYIATLDGNTDSLVLPSPLTAFLPTSRMQHNQPHQTTNGKRKASENISYKGI